MATQNTSDSRPLATINYIGNDASYCYDCYRYNESHRLLLTHAYHGFFYNNNTERRAVPLRHMQLLFVVKSVTFITGQKEHEFVII